MSASGLLSDVSRMILRRSVLSSHIPAKKEPSEMRWTLSSSGGDKGGFTPVRFPREVSARIARHLGGWTLQRCL
jgi:hypothetical protein